MKPRKPSGRRKADRIDDSRKKDRRKGARRNPYVKTRRLGLEEYPKTDIGDRPSPGKKYFRVPEHVYEEQLKNQKGISVTSKKLNREENYVEMINRRVSKKPGKRAKDKKK